MNDSPDLRRQVTHCPVCETSLAVTELTCGSCHTRLTGHFDLPPLARLPREHQEFVETFLRCRGVIRDVERELGISYPTVRARLDGVVEAIEALYQPPALPHSAISSDREERRRALLRRVEEGTLGPEEAAILLRHL